MVEKVAVIRGFKGFQKILSQKISSTYYAGSYIKTNGAATIYFWRTIGEQAMKAFIYKGLNVFFDGSNPFLCAIPTVLCKKHCIKPYFLRIFE